MKTLLMIFALVASFACAQSAEHRHTINVPQAATEAIQARMQILGPYSVAVNYPADLAGVPDPEFWGFAGAQTDVVTFNVPPGYRVRVLHLDGNYMAWARGVYLPGKHAGTSWGIATTAAPGSTRVAYSADNCFVYLEYAISNAEVNQRFSLNTKTGGLLEPDNIMNVVLAVYLNDQPISIHAEVTGIVQFQYERQDGPQ